jgi:hypothetical protein
MHDSQRAKGRQTVTGNWPFLALIPLAAALNGAALATDAQGRLVTHSTGPIVGRALQAATAAGQFFEVLLTP